MVGTTTLTSWGKKNWSKISSGALMPNMPPSMYLYFFRQCSDCVVDSSSSDDEKIVDTEAPRRLRKSNDEHSVNFLVFYFIFWFFFSIIFRVQIVRLVICFSFNLFFSMILKNLNQKQNLRLKVNLSQKPLRMSRWTGPKNPQVTKFIVFATQSCQ